MRLTIRNAELHMFCVILGGSEKTEKLNKSASLSSADSNSSSDSKSKKQVLASKLSTIIKKEDSTDHGHEQQHSGSPSEALMEPDTVVVIPIADGNNCSSDPPGFLSEEQVLARTRQSSRVVRMNLANLTSNDDRDHSEDNNSTGHVGEKRTRFSISHDDGSIGNTSDNLEAISEAASDHSVDSSLEDEVDQAEDPIIDNLSDMVSANVSGRGTPNVSGRDTPSSQVTEGDELGRANVNEDEPVGAAGGAGQLPLLPARGQSGDKDQAGVNPVEQGRGRGGAASVRGVGVVRGIAGRNRRQNDLEEKFGRFEIKPPRSITGSSSLHGDETVSMVSYGTKETFWTVFDAYSIRSPTRGPPMCSPPTRKPWAKANCRPRPPRAT